MFLWELQVGKIEIMTLGIMLLNSGHLPQVHVRVTRECEQDMFEAMGNVSPIFV